MFKYIGNQVSSLKSLYRPKQNLYKIRNQLKRCTDKRKLDERVAMAGIPVRVTLNIQGYIIKTKLCYVTKQNILK